MKPIVEQGHGIYRFTRRSIGHAEGSKKKIFLHDLIGLRVLVSIGRKARYRRYKVLER